MGHGYGVTLPYQADWWRWPKKLRMEFQTWQAGGFPMLLHDHRFHIQVGLGDAEVIMKFLGRCTCQKCAQDIGERGLPSVDHLLSACQVCNLMELQTPKDLECWVPGWNQDVGNGSGVGNFVRS